MVQPLLRDVAAVALGMRAAAMLDYVRHLDAATLLEVLRPHTNARLLVATLDGCLYVLNARVLEHSNLQRLCVVFGGADGLCAVQVATPTQYQVQLVEHAA